MSYADLNVVVFSCCREYLGVLGIDGHRCVYCGARPKYERQDCCRHSYQCPVTGKVECREHTLAPESRTSCFCNNILCPGNDPVAIAKRYQ